MLDCPDEELLELLAAGRSNDAIARELFISSKTVRNVVSAIYAKLHAAGRAEAIIKARDAGFGRPEVPTWPTNGRPGRGSAGVVVVPLPPRLQEHPWPRGCWPGPR